MRCLCLSFWTTVSNARLPMAAAVLALASPVLVSPALAFDVASESTGNVFHLQLDDRVGAAIGGELHIDIESASDWLVAGEISVSNGRVTQITVPFDVLTVVDGSRGHFDLVVRASDSAGDELFTATHSVPITVRPAVGDVQHAFGITECCMEIVDVNELDTMPSALKVVGNTPNPFRSLTNIVFGLPVEGGVAEVQVFDIQGRLVRAIATPRLSGGFHRVTWDGRNESGQSAAPGAYFYRVTVGTESVTRKLHLLP